MFEVRSCSRHMPPVQHKMHSQIPNYTLSRKQFLQAFPDDPRSEDVPVRSAPRGCRPFLESLDGSSTCSCVISEINERTEHAYTEIRVVSMLGLPGVPRRRNGHNNGSRTANVRWCIFDKIQSPRTTCVAPISAQSCLKNISRGYRCCETPVVGRTASSAVQSASVRYGTAVSLIVMAPLSYGTMLKRAATMRRPKPSKSVQRC
ncbi:hypothetical protein C2E23DRAFT_35024 [Lenzites betulinus]|nr:hypothetical protein C2E23DRAFT_35024 [Lenzites betulinus]